MAVTAPIEGETQHNRVLDDDIAVSDGAQDRSGDGIVIIADDVSTDEVLVRPEASAATHAEPVMLFVYLGILTLLAIIATSAFLAL